MSLKLMKSKAAPKKLGIDKVVSKKKEKPPSKPAATAAKGPPDQPLSEKYHKTMKSVLEDKHNIEKAEEAVTLAKQALSAKLAKIGQMSFKFGKKFYSIRNRAGNRYIIELDEPAGSHLRKKGKKKDG